MTPPASRLRGVIRKYEVELMQEFTLTLPMGSRVLSAEYKDGKLAVYVVANMSSLFSTCKFILFPDGALFTDFDLYKHLLTFQAVNEPTVGKPDGLITYHLFYFFN
jgi:hypothetical protein